MKQSPILLALFAPCLLLLGFACGPDPAATTQVARSESTVVNALDLDQCILTEISTDKQVIDATQPEGYVDENREIKDFGTAFVVKEFFKTPETLYNFMNLVYGTIEKDLDAYKAKNHLPDDSITLLFKGGNVLRIIGNRLFAITIPEARDLLQKSYADVLKRSDADFAAIVNPLSLGTEDYEKTMQNLAMVIYDSLNEIRTDLTQNAEKYFDFFQLKTAVAQEDLKKYFDELPKLASVSGGDNTLWSGADFAQMQIAYVAAKDEPECKYAGNFDFRFDIDPKDPNQIVGTVLDKAKPHWIMNTINTTLVWPAGAVPNALVKFYLMRSKVQAELSYKLGEELIKKPIGFELIDVSMPHKDDFRLMEFVHNLDAWVASYKLSYNGGSFVMKAESIEGISDDIQNVLFKQFSRVWEDRKYEKRLRRLYLLGITEMLADYGTGSREAQAYADSLKNDFIAPLRQIYEDEDQTAIINNVKKKVNDLVNLAPRMKVLNKVNQNIVDMVQQQLIKNPKEDDQQKFMEMLNEVERNTDVIQELSKMRPSVIDMNKIYNVDMESLL